MLYDSGAYSLLLHHKSAILNNTLLHDAYRFALFITYTMHGKDQV